MGSKEEPLLPDFGNHLWDSGSRNTLVTLIGVQWVEMVNYGRMRELSGSFQSDAGSFVVTVRTRQTEDELAALLEGRHPAAISFIGKVVAKIEVGNSGEPYRVIVGRLVVADEKLTGGGVPHD